MEPDNELSVELDWWEASPYQFFTPDGLPDIWPVLEAEHPFLTGLLIRIEGGPTGLCLRIPDDDYRADTASLAAALRDLRERLTGERPPDWMNGNRVGLPGIWYVFLHDPS